MTVAEDIVEQITAHNVHDVFLLSGGGMMYMLDALGKEKSITIHCHHHEQNAGIAAEAYARITKNVGVCFATSGPGGLNLMEAIGECWLDSVPVVFFVGQNALDQSSRASGISGLRQHGPFEIDTIPMMKPITKETYFIDDPATADSLIWEAFFLATSGRPGPVVVVVPTDIQRTFINSSYVDSAHAIRQLQTARRPLFLLGKGVSSWNDRASILEYALAHYIPIVTTQAAKDLMDDYDPLFIGHVGIKADRGANKRIQEADLIICLGTSLNIFTTGYKRGNFAPHAYIIHIDPDKATLQKNNDLHCYIPICKSVSQFMSDLQDLHFEEKRRSTLWCKRERYEEIYENEAGRLNIYNAIKIVNEFSNSDDIIVSDAGSSFYAVGQAWKNKIGQRFISSNSLGSMGWALSAAMGAWVASKKRVLCFTGDGSFMTGISELSHITFEQANIKMFVFNNNGYVSIRNTQDTFFGGRHVGTDEGNGVRIPSLKELANANGIIEYVCITSEEQLKMLMPTILETFGPMVIDIQTNIHQKIEPTVGNIVNGDGSIGSSTLDDMEPRQ